VRQRLPGHLGSGRGVCRTEALQIDGPMFDLLAVADETVLGEDARPDGRAS